MFRNNFFQDTRRDWCIECIRICIIRISRSFQIIVNVITVRKILYILVIFWDDEKSHEITPRSWASSIQARAVIAWLSEKHESMISLVENNFKTPNVHVVINQLESGEKHTLCIAPSCFWKHLNTRTENVHHYMIVIDKHGKNVDQQTNRVNYRVKYNAPANKSIYRLIVYGSRY